MKCPSCKAEAADGAAECPSCGVIFAKFEQRRRREREEAARALAQLDAAPAPTVHPHLGRAIAGVVLTAWFGARASERPRPRRLPFRSSRRRSRAARRRAASPFRTARAPRPR
jgi:hypothetical protein